MYILLNMILQYVLSVRDIMYVLTVQDTIFPLFPPLFKATQMYIC